MKHQKVVQVNGVKAIIKHSKWTGWTAQHATDGLQLSGHGDSLRGLRQSIHWATSPEAREKINRLMA